MPKPDEQFVGQAKMVLDFNWNGEYTHPGLHLYPHQWSWDSALIAVGQARYDQERATSELTHIFESQWRNGMLPQIIFNPSFGQYFPGIDFWHAERSPYVPRDRKTTGVVQPPVHATAVLQVYVTPNFVPLYSGIPGEERARRMVESLQNTGFGLSDENVMPVPSYDRYGFAFLPTQYWRGPIWANINWFLMQGLERYGYEEQADLLRETIVSLCREQGFYEYYDPTTGFGHGSDLFSWTAALFLDVVFED